MIGVGLRDLADGLALVATHFSRGDGEEAFYILDENFQVLARGGAASLDRRRALVSTSESGKPRLRLDKDRIGVLESVDLSNGEQCHVVVTSGKEGDLERLKVFAAWLGDVLQREGLRDFESEDTTAHLLGCFEQIRAVHDLADRLPERESASEMARLCLRSLIRAVPARRAGVYFEGGGEGEGLTLLFDEQGRDCEEELPPRPIVLGPTREVLETGTVAYGPIDRYGIPPGSLEELAERDLCIVPIGQGRGPKGAPLGAIFLFDHIRSVGGRCIPFGNPEAEMAQSVAVLLGLAVDTRRRVAAEKELQIARTIQETLNPRNPPRWRGLELAGVNRLANQVGGDYFDWLEGPRGRKHLLIADVSGHNMASAMAMVMARSQIRLLVESESSPSAILGRLAAALHKDLTRNELFLTAFHMTLEKSRTGWVMRYTNAGHNPPLLLRADGSLEWLEGGGPVVGFLPSVEYEEMKGRLEPGDLLVLYTDGVTEAQDPRGEMLGEEGLRVRVGDLRDESAEGILGGILEAVEARSGPGGQEDDVTVLVLKVPGGGAPKEDIEEPAS